MEQNKRSRSERVYDALLRLVPDREGAVRREMREVFRDALRDDARGAPWRLWAGALIDLGRTVLALRRPRPRAWLESVFADLRFGLRALRASPGFSAVVVLTLGLAIGVNSTIFSLGRLALFPPLPIENPDTLVFVRGANPELNRVRAGISAADLADLKADSTTLADLAGFTVGSLTLTGVDQPTRLGAAHATANLFDVFGLDPVRGRRFRPGEDEPGAAPVALLGHGAWQRHFGAGSSIIGESITLDGVDHTVVGVLPESLELGALAGIEVWTPLRRDPTGAARAERELSAIGRLAPGASLPAARDELLALSAALQREHPDTNAGWQAQAVSFTEAVAGSNATALFGLLSGAVLFILAIACANVANLMLARAAVRRQELAVRRAMGARRGRLVRQLVTESGVLAVLSAAAGVLLAHWTLQGLVVLGRGGVPLFEDARIDGGVLGFAAALALLTPLLFGIVPALRSTGFDLAGATRQGTGGATAGRPRRLLPRSGTALAALQVALAVVLLVVAGLTTRSMIALVNIELGYDGDNVLTLEVELPDIYGPGGPGDPGGEDGPDGQRERAVIFFEQTQTSIEATPAIARAAWTSRLPLSGGQTNRSVAIEGRPAAGEADVAWVDTVVVTPGYFATLDIPVTRGRSLQASDTAAGRPVALISEAAVARYWSGAGAGDPVGARVKLGGLEAEAPWLEIVGVVGDLRNPDADQPPAPQLYLPMAQHPTTSMALVARTGAGGQAVAAIDEVRRAIWSIAPNQPIDNVRTMGEVLYDDFAGSISIVGLATFLAFVALCLAAAGVYAVIAFRVSRRQRDIGIRMALGARRAAVLTMVMRQGLAPLLAGLLLGLAGGFAISRLIAGSLFGVGPSDPVIFLGVPALLLAIGVVASLVPALRATRIDPLEAVRAG